MPDSTPLVSVVTPFHNTEEYLAECIESVISQTYGNWEYILVNNASSDRSREIAASYVRKSPRIKLLDTPEFLSQIANYNFALSKISAASRYCKIVQADDWLFPCCLEEMVRVAERDESIGVVAGYRLMGAQINNDGLSYTTATLSGPTVCKAMLLPGARQLFGSPTTVMYRAEIVRNRRPFFSENQHFEDSDAVFEILRSSNFGFAFALCAFERLFNEGLTSNSLRHDPGWLLAKYLRVLRHGPSFLSDHEYRQRRREVESEYYRYLARHLLLGPGKEFWDYHRSALTLEGYQLSIAKTLRSFASETFCLLINPTRAVAAGRRFLGNMAKKIRRRGDQQSSSSAAN